MILSDTSIRRPVFATVISLMVVVLGLAAGSKLPIREYPAIDPEADAWQKGIVPQLEVAKH